MDAHGRSVGIAALWYDAVELLPQWIELLRGAIEWDKVILVDNGATLEWTMPYMRAAAELQEQALRPVDVLQLHENSVLHGWNEGVAQLDTDIVVTMACDVKLVDWHWLAWAIEGIEPGVLQGPIVKRQPQAPLVPYVDGCCAVYMRQDWQRLGGLDAEYYRHPGYWSDVDIAWRALRLGMRIRQTLCGIEHLENYVVNRVLGVEKRDRLSEVNRLRFFARVLEEAADGGG